MFWAQDGSVYFANAYNDGWLAPLFRPYGGYLQLVPRLVADIATIPPLRFAPLLIVWVALLIRAAIPAFIFSSRFNWIDWRGKIAIVAFFLLMPNLAEVHANLTNTQWYLGIYLLAVILADPPRTRAWVVHDWAVLVAAGLTGPMIIFVLPALGFRVLAQRGLPSARLAFAGVAAILAIGQIALLVTTAFASASGVIDGGIFAIPQLLVSRVILGFITPIRWEGALSTLVIAVPALFLGLAVTIAVLVRGDWRGRGVAVDPDPDRRGGHLHADLCVRSGAMGTDLGGDGRRLFRRRRRHLGGNAGPLFGDLSAAYVERGTGRARARCRVADPVRLPPSAGHRSLVRSRGRAGRCSWLR